MAVSYNTGLIVFPELSLTGYEPGLAEVLATNHQDTIFDPLQQISDNSKITICVGMPTKTGSGILISMIIFQPDEPRQIYSKQQLHKDELPYFINGTEQLYLTFNNIKVAPAICYESLLKEHSEQCFKNGAKIYIASVAKSAEGVEKAFKHFPDVASKYGMTVLMSNSIGPSDNFLSAGKTSIWNDKGLLVGQLNDVDEGILIIDIDSQQIVSTTV